MVNILLYHRTYAKDKTTGYVWVQFYLKREKINFSTKIECDSKHWNEKNLRVSVADKEAKDKNLILENTLARINNVFVQYRLRNKQLTRDGFKKAYNRPDDFNTFYEFCDKYKKEISGYTEDGTMATHKKALKKLQDFAPDLHFDDINIDFLKKYFFGHLTKKIETTKGAQKGLGNMHSTAYKDMAVIKKYLYAAIRAGYMDENPFKEFKIKRTVGSFTFLTEMELKKLLKIYHQGELTPDLYKTLQLFLYMCFSSQHIGDAMKTKIEDFGKDTFSYVRKKLKNSKPILITIPISQPLRDMLNDIVGYRKKGLIFNDMPTEQAMNRNLKTIAKMEGVEIDKKISHKSGRHTFATFYYLKTTDLYGLKELMGHSDIRETIKYVHLMVEDQQVNMNYFDTFMQQPEKAEQ